VHDRGIGSTLAARALVIVWAVLSSCGTATAQDVHPYVGGAIEVSSFGTHSWTGSPSLSYNNATDDSMVVGIVGEGGAFFGSNVAIGAEINLPVGRSDIAQRHGYFNPFNRQSRYQERSLFAILRGYVPLGRRVRAGILAGAGIVFASSLDGMSSCNFDTRIPCTPFSPEQETTRSALGATLGSDVVIQATRHLSVVPQFRVVWVGRGDPASSSGGDRDVVSLGLDQPSYRAAIGIRATF
jgi:hypothetical protein